MNKLLGLFLLALACWAPDLAQAAARFAVCSTTCTWDNTSTAMWSTTSGGATGASAPVAGDDVTLDAATCVGGTTCTITTFAGTISARSITWGECTASTTGCIIAADTNNTNFTITASNGTLFTGSGTGVRQWKAGTGTYTITANGPFANFFSMSTVTNDTSVFSGATWVAAGATDGGPRVWTGGGKSFGPTTFNGNSSGGSVLIIGNNTFASLTINGLNSIFFGNGNTQTITGALTVTGSSSAPVQLGSNNFDSPYTLSLGAPSTATWVALHALVTSGGNALTATNCLNLGLNTLASSGSCTAPSAGGGGGGRIIGG